MSYDRNNQLGTDNMGRNRNERNDFNNDFNTSNQPMGANEFARGGAQNLGPNTHDDAAGYGNVNNVPGGAPAPHHAGATTAGMNRHDNDYGNFQGQRGAEFTGRGGTQDFSGTHASATGAGYGPAAGTGPTSGAAYGTGVGTGFQRDITDTGVDRHRNQFAGDPTATDVDRHTQFGPTATGTGMAGTGAGLATGHRHNRDEFNSTSGTDNFDNTRGSGNFDHTAHGAGIAPHHGTATTTATGTHHNDFNDNHGGPGAFNNPNRGPGTGNPTMGDKIKGTLDKMVGKLTDNQDLQQRGEARQTGGTF